MIPSVRCINCGTVIARCLDMILTIRTSGTVHEVGYTCSRRCYEDSRVGLAYRVSPI